MTEVQDKAFMKKALTLARKGVGMVNPNPMVGAVVVKDGKVIGEGWHACYGEAHAEVNALGNLEAGLTEGATLYVTMEPCNHTGKTPPCTDLILAKKITRVVIAAGDPNPLVNGKGIARLREAGVTVVTGVLQKEADQLNEIFRHFIVTGLPFVLLKTAMTLDGKIATITNASRWITGEHSRRYVHRLRTQYSAVMAGIETILYDNPLLNVRLKDPTRNPLKIIADSQLRIPHDVRVLSNEPQLTLVAVTGNAAVDKIRAVERLGAQVVVCPEAGGRIDLRFLMQALGSMGIDSIILEGGSTLAFSALRAGIVSKVTTFIAPKLLGGATAPTAVGGDGIARMEEAIPIRSMTVRKLGEDLMVEGYVVNGDA